MEKKLQIKTEVLHVVEESRTSNDYTCTVHIHIYTVRLKTGFTWVMHHQENISV